MDTYGVHHRKEDVIDLPKKLTARIASVSQHNTYPSREHVE